MESIEKPVASLKLNNRDAYLLSFVKLDYLSLTKFNCFVNEEFILKDIFNL